MRRIDLDRDAPYRRSGSSRYRGGAHRRALAALAVGVAPNVPGFLDAAGFVESVPALWSDLSTYD